jgi:hypothetical protein
MAAGSKAARVAFGKEAMGFTGDPWTPTEIKDSEAKALTIDGRGFSYKRLSRLRWRPLRSHWSLGLPFALSGDATRPIAILSRLLFRR